MTILKKIYIATYAAAVTAGAIFLFAGEAKAEKVATTGIYGVYLTGKSCYAITSAKSGPKEIFGFGLHGVLGTPWLRFGYAGWNLPDDNKYRVTVVVDGHKSFSGNAYVNDDTNDRGYSMLDISFDKGVALLNAIRSGSGVKLYASSGKQTASWTLQGSSKALAHVITCWEANLKDATSDPFKSPASAKTDPFSERQS